MHFTTNIYVIRSMECYYERKVKKMKFKQKIKKHEANRRF